MSCSQFYLKIMRIISVLQPMGTEVMIGQKAKISCIFTGLTKQLDSIFWVKSGGARVSYLSNFVEEPGLFNEKTKSQTSTLEVPGSENTADSEYVCQFTSLEWGRVNDKSVAVPLLVYGWFILKSHISTWKSFIVHFWCDLFKEQFCGETFQFLRRSAEWLTTFLSYNFLKHNWDLITINLTNHNFSAVIPYGVDFSFGKHLASKTSIRTNLTQSIWECIWHTFSASYNPINLYLSHQFFVVLPIILPF